MPFVVCEKHGGAPAPMVCSHLRDKILAGLRIEKPAVVEAVDSELGPVWVVRLCQECAKRLGYSEFRTTFRSGCEVQPADDGLERVFVAIEDQVPVCAGCFREAGGDNTYSN
jgi:hypothetical protein